MNKKRRTNWFVVVQGIVVFCIMLPFVPPQIAFMRTSKVALAEVVKLNAGRHPQVEFTTADGQRISVPTSTWQSVDVGDRFEMRYDPANPRIAHVNSLWGLWGIHVIFSLVSAGLVLGGVLGLSAKRSEGESNND